MNPLLDCPKKLDKKSKGEILVKYLLKINDVNYIDENGRTIMSVVVENDVTDVMFIVNLIYLGYNVSEFNIIQGGIITPFSNQNPFIKDILTSDYLPYSRSDSGILFSRTNNSDVFFCRKNGDINSYVMKQSSDNLILKEIFFLRRINSNFHDVTCKYFDSFYKDDGMILVIEYLPFTLLDVISVIIKSEIMKETLKETLKVILKDLILKLRKINSLGICHFDIKMNNIMVCPNLTVRIIDFGLSIYAGCSPINLYLSTADIKAPDDSFDDNSQILNHESELNYSTDFFSVACIVTTAIFGFNIQCLYMHNNFYLCKRSNDVTGKITKIDYLIPFLEIHLEAIKGFEDFLKIACVSNSKFRASSFSEFPMFSIPKFDPNFYRQNSLINVEMGKNNNIIFESEDLDTYCNVKILISKIPHVGKTELQSHFISNIRYNISLEIFKGDFYEEINHLIYPIKIGYEFIFFEDLICCYIKQHENINKIALENFKFGIRDYLISKIDSCRSFNVYQLFDHFLERCYTE